jgi:chorismate dehydratase
MKVMLRVAASSYLNTAPLIWSYLYGSRRHELELLTHTAPALCADMLARAEVDAALVPVIEYQRIPEAALVPDVCIGSSNQVRSVVLATPRSKLTDVRTVALDAESRTSSALVRIIFREFLGLEPAWTDCAPDLGRMLKANDAAVLIGDPAMLFDRSGLFVYDLAGLWRQYTGLGFVFAMWMAREGADNAIDFVAARDEGLEHVDEIAAHYEKSLGLPRSELRDYLLNNISFSLDAEMRSGLELFYSLSHKHGIIQGIRPFIFLGPDPRPGNPKLRTPNTAERI